MAAVSQGFGGALYVGDLQQDVTEATLFEHFSAAGPVASVRVCRDAATRRSLGYAYVNYHRVEDAEKALDTLNGKQVNGRCCRVMWSQRDPALRKSNVGNIFVKNLADSIDIKTLYDTFSMFGNILSCKVVTDKDGKSLGYGFVHYETENAAQDAISRVNGKIISGQQVEVSHFVPKKARSTDKKDEKKVNDTKVYVHSIPEGTSEDELKALFSKCGKWKSGAIMKIPPGNKVTYYVVQDDDQEVKKEETVQPGKDFAIIQGFVNFETPEEAIKALELNDTVFKGFKIKVSLSRNAMAKLVKELYVASLPQNTANDDLEALFGQYGHFKPAIRQSLPGVTVTYFTEDGQKHVHKIAVDAPSPVVHALLDFETPEQATEALQLNKTTYKGYQLLVVIKKTRFERQKEQEARKKQFKEEFYRRTSGLNVYVKGLAETIDEKRLRDEFSVFGHISSAKVQVDAGGKSMGFGYVCFQTTAQATEAITKMNNRTIDGKTLTVTLHQRKEDRVAALEQYARHKYQQALHHPGYYMGALPRNMMYPAYVRQPRWPTQAMPPFYPPAAPMMPNQQQRYHLLPAGGAPQQRPFQEQPRVQQQRARPMGPDQPMKRPMPRPNQQAGNQQRRPPTQAQRRPNMWPSETDLASMNPNQQKQVLGENLFKQIHPINQELAGKITGMLLEMENSDIVTLLSDRSMLISKVGEAIEVLNQAKLNQ